MTRRTERDIVGEYPVGDIADAREDLARLRRDCHDAQMYVAGDRVFLAIAPATLRRETWD